jgi:hypothetical protein
MDRRPGRSVEAQVAELDPTAGDRRLPDRAVRSAAALVGLPGLKI